MKETKWDRGRRTKGERGVKKRKSDYRKASDKRSAERGSHEEEKMR